MFNFLSFTWYFVLQSFGLIIAFVFAGLFLFLVLRKLHSKLIATVLIFVFLGVSVFFYVPNGLPHGLQYPFNLNTYGPGAGPVLTLSNVINFFTHFNSFERVADIARNPSDVPPPITRTEPTTVYFTLTTKEVITEVAPGVFLNVWTFDGKIPGTFLRVREGDTVVLTLKNDPTSLHYHNIDLHAVTGPGGGAVATMVAPGESKTLTFKALNPGIFVYHCATANVASHMTHGMYGLILVEPSEGLPKVDKEFYVMQGEYYETGELGRKGLQFFDAQAMLDGKPQYIVFNGRVGGVSTTTMQAKVGEKVRIFVGNGGVNLTSNFHMIGEIFDHVYAEGSLSTPPLESVQTTIVPAGGATVVEFGLEYPGNYILVDHALARMERGAWGMGHVSGNG